METLQTVYVGITKCTHAADVLHPNLHCEDYQGRSLTRVRPVPIVNTMSVG